MGITIIVLAVMCLLSFVADQADGYPGGESWKVMRKRCEVSLKSIGHG